MNRSRLRKLWQSLLLAVSLSTILVGAGIWEGWNTRQKLEPRGGLPFWRRVEIAGPVFRQNDERWGSDVLGATGATLGAEGCAVASAAMVLASYGIDTDPGQLNAFLKTNEGYTPQGWLYWEKAAAFAPERVRHVYEDLPSYWIIDSNLLRKNPVIARLRQRNGITHFVVIAGKQGFDYLTRDPGAGASKGLYPLREFGSPIEAVRFYEKL
ncbi:MAG: C39 family peptidase [Verrucomicrobiota bacterium]|nr:C39 family peptidase [Verrucomicrobiota bacterium]